MERLKRRTDFQAAAKGARAPASGFVLQARSRGDEGACRVGFTVSRQVGNAVERNRVRRRLREAVRLAPQAVLCAGQDYVLIGRRAALQVPFPDLVRELDAALHRVHGAQTGEKTATGTASTGRLHKAGRSGTRSSGAGPSRRTGAANRTAKRTD